jgi:hypothetical protein
MEATWVFNILKLKMTNTSESVEEREKRGSERSGQGSDGQ